MLKNWIKIHQTILISRISSEEEDWYLSKIQDVDKKYFYIDMPYQKDRPLVLRRDEQVKARILLDGERIEFKSIVLGKRYDNIRLYVLPIPIDYIRIQLRSFVRLPIMMEVFYAEMPEKAKETPEFVKTTTLDISGGGIRVLIDKEYPSGTVLLLRFALLTKDMNFEINVTGKVSRTFRSEQIGKIHAAIEFTDISTRQQDLIMRFIIQKMSSSRQTK